MRKLTIWGASVLLATGLVVIPASGASAQSDAVVGMASTVHSASKVLVEDVSMLSDVPTGVLASIQGETEVLAATEESTRIASALIALILVGGGLTLFTLRRRSALRD